MFFGFDAGDVTFGAGAVKEVHPELWGWGTTPSVNTLAIKSAIASAYSGAIVKFSQSASIDDEILIGKNYLTIDLGGITITQTGVSKMGFRSSGDVTRDHLIIKKGKIIHTGGGTGAPGIYLVGSPTNIIIENIETENTPHSGIFIGGDQVGDNIKIIKCRVTNPGDAGIQVRGNRVWVLDNYVAGSPYNGIDMNVICPIVKGNHCEGNGTSTGTVDTTARNGIYIGIDDVGGSHDGIVMGNKCLNNGNTTCPGDGICIDGHRFIVSNNICRDNKRHGIQTRWSQDIVSTDNNISNNGIQGSIHYGLLLDGPRSVIKGNNLYSNKDRQIGIKANGIASGNVIIGVAGSSQGIEVSGDDSIIQGNRIDTLDTEGVIVQAGSNRTHIFDNVILNVTTTPINDLGTGTVRRGNCLTTGSMQGQAVLVAGTVTVDTTEVLASDNILLSCVQYGGGAGAHRVGTITPGVSFVINSSNAADTGTIFWQIVH